MSYISVDYMRSEISKMYPGPSWRKKVQNMPDNQVMAIYYDKQSTDISNLEMSFFRSCYILTYGGCLWPADIIDMSYEDESVKKKCREFLKKWDDLGFYMYLSILDLGFFCKQKMPKRYLDIIKDVNF